MEDYTYTFVSNCRFSTKKQILKSISYEDGETSRGRFPAYHAAPLPMIELHSDDEGNSASVGCIQLAPHKFLLVENNGRNTMRTPNMIRLTIPTSHNASEVPVLIALAVCSPKYQDIAVASRGDIHYVGPLQEGMQWKVDEKVWDSVFASAFSVIDDDPQLILKKMADLIDVPFDQRWTSDQLTLSYGHWMPYEPADQDQDDPDDGSEFQN